MKYVFLFFILIFTNSCFKPSAIPDYGIEIEVFDSSNNNLLDSNYINFYPYNKIKIYELENNIQSLLAISSGGNSNSYKIEKSEIDSNFYLHLYGPLTSDLWNDKILRYFYYWPDNTIDTIDIQFRINDNLKTYKKVWLNGELKIDRDIIDIRGFRIQK